MEYSDNDSPELRDWKMNREMALGVHARHDESGHALFRASIDFGLEAIRTAALINGGAVLACFAFLGSMRSSTDPQSVLMFKALLPPAFIFIGGAVLAGASSGWAWFAQRFFMNAHSMVTHAWDFPNFVIDKPERKAMDDKGFLFQRLCVGFVILSYLCIVAGVVLGGIGLIT